MTFCLATASFRVILSLPVSSRGPTEFRSSSRTLEPSAADPSRATFPDFLRAGSRTIAQAFVNATARETGIERGDRETTASYFCLFFFFFFYPSFGIGRRTNERSSGTGSFGANETGTRRSIFGIREEPRTIPSRGIREVRGARERERERELGEKNPVEGGNPLEGRGKKKNQRKTR